MNLQPTCTDVVVLVHGIRDFALWQNSVRCSFEKAGLTVEATNYGRLNLIRFLLPFRWARSYAVKAVAKQIRMVQLLHPNKRISVIAHSFGTHVVASLLHDEFDVRFHRVIFCGSVVRYDFPFENCTGRFEPDLLNEVGTADIWPAIAQSLTVGYGSAGTYGFRRPFVRDRWHNGAGHGFFLTPTFADEFWVPFLASGKIVPGSDPAIEPSTWVKFVSTFQIKYLVSAAIFVGLAFALITILSILESPSSQPPAPARARVLSGGEINAHTPAGTLFRDCPICPLMVVVPAGSFVMGASPGDDLAEQDEKPPRNVVVMRPFALSVYEATFREWEAGVEAGALAQSNDKGQGAARDPSGWGKGNRPVIFVTHDQAASYVQWLNRELGQTLYRLPSEAEWEYAARAGAKTRYPLGDRYNSAMVSDGPYQTEIVGSYPPNRFGLYDMQGNVWEWTADCWHPDYSGAPGDQSAWTTGGNYDCSRHPIRGGSWGKEPTEMRLSNRYPSGGQGPRLGFRVSRELE